jgi:hypothetical protein
MVLLYLDDLRDIGRGISASFNLSCRRKKKGCE